MTLLLLWLFCLPRELFSGVPCSTVVTAADGTLLGARVADDGQWRFPPCDSVPEKFARALIEYEDRGFRSHCGVSPGAVARALWQNLTSGRVVSGASTITMQTIRLHRRGPRNLPEKIVEMFMATRLELRCSKEEILRLYASHAPFGGNIVGIDAALWRYLGDDGNDMSWAEAATLAVLQNAPATVHLSKNRDRLLEKRNSLLRRLRDRGELTDEEYELAVDEPLIGRPCPMPVAAPHLVEHYNQTRHGLLTRTTIDPRLQRRVESAAACWRDELSRSGIRDLAVVVADVASGEIAAYCGNADIAAERDGRWVDIARAPRSSGSILKPLLYCAALQEGQILAGSLLPDVPTNFGGFTPKNFDGNYSGVVAADEALALSLNVPNVALLKEFGVSRFASILQKAGLTTLNRPAHEYGLSLILGGAEVSLADIVGCYTKLARGERDFPLNDSVAVYAMFDAMRRVNRPDQLDYSRVSDIQNIAWKTGTSYGARDGWAVGVTPGYVVGVWAGNADGSGVADLTGARTAGPVMFDIFDLLPRSGWFRRPAGRRVSVCRRSGHLAGPACGDTEIQTVCANALKSSVCPYCREIAVSLDGLRRVTDCSEPSQRVSWFILSPLQSHFYRLQHADYVEPPADTSVSADHIRFLYPSAGAVIAFPGEAGNAMTCKATHTDASATLFWHLDNSFIGSTRDIHQLRIAPRPGFHRLTIVDDRGASETVGFIVRR
ncbi:MAG: penicillin-binding protein 1C [Clostridium sp.]|nr:penicillin-binding protein 1C [Clostridium sp.]